ncbi:MAG: MlaD family protein [Candidatus Gastranaerophilales bacterium]
MEKNINIRKYIFLEILVWAFVLIIGTVGLRTYNYIHKKTALTYQIFISDVDGLVIGSPVKFLGVEIGYVDKIKIINNEVYVKIVMLDKNIELPHGVIATVESNGLGGSKSIEMFAPTEQSLKTKQLISVKSPTRLNDATILMNDMFEKIDSISNKFSIFAKEFELIVDKDIEGFDTKKIQSNVEYLDNWLDEPKSKRIRTLKNKLQTN